MATALDLISSALRLINVVAAGEPTPIDYANDSLMVLNDMIDSWNTDRLTIFTTKSSDFPLVLNKQSYTLGVGGDFNMPRPPAIDALSVILLYNPDVPVELPITMFTVDEWQTQIPVKNVPGSIPLICYDTGDFPLRTLNFWPIPTEPLNNVRIYSWSPLAGYATLATTVNVPPGYREAFRYNLAVRLAAEFAAQVPPVVASVAAESLARIKTLNSPDLTLKSDLVRDSTTWNWKADLFGIPF